MAIVSFLILVFPPDMVYTGEYHKTARAATIEAALVIFPLLGHAAQNLYFGKDEKV